MGRRAVGEWAGRLAEGQKFDPETQTIVEAAKVRIRFMAGKEQAQRTLLMTADTVGGVLDLCPGAGRSARSMGNKSSPGHHGQASLPFFQQKQAAAISNLLLHESEFQLEWMENPWQEVEEAGQWLMSLERELQPELIHLNNYCHGQLPWRAPVLMTGHSCVLSWWQDVKGEPAPGEIPKIL